MLTWAFRESQCSGNPCVSAPLFTTPSGCLDRIRVAESKVRGSVVVVVVSDRSSFDS